MSEYRTVNIFEKPGEDLRNALTECISWVQLVFCCPYPSEYFSSITTLSSEDYSYIEQYMTFPSEEVFLQWFDVFGETAEELVKEMCQEFDNNDIQLTRYFENLELVNLYKVLDLKLFQTKFNESYPSKSIFNLDDSGI
jgi:hypothetical protein